MTQRLVDKLYFLQKKLKKFNDFVMMKFFIHHPGQLIRSFNKPTYETILYDFEWQRNLVSMALSQVSVLRRRKDANNPCNPNLHDEDSIIRKKIISKVGCMPIYWKFLFDEELNARECKSGPELEAVYNYTQNFGEILSTHDPPCDDMQTSTNVNQKRRFGSWLLAVYLTYTDSKYQEIINEKEFSLETFWSSVVGFVGIFMGYSLLQIPHLIELVGIWLKSLCDNFKSV